MTPLSEPQGCSIPAAPARPPRAWLPTFRDRNAALSTSTPTPSGRRQKDGTLGSVSQTETLPNAVGPGHSGSHVLKSDLTRTGFGGPHAGSGELKDKGRARHEDLPEVVHACHARRR